MFTQANTPSLNIETSTRPIRSKPFRLPKDDATPEPYVTALKINCPFEYYTIAGLSFQKFVMPSEWSLARNSGNTLIPRRVVRNLTEKQVKELREEINSREVFIPQRHNKNFDPKDPDSKQFLPAITVKLGQYVIIEKRDTFNEYKVDNEEKEQAVPVAKDKIKNARDK